MSSLNSEPEIMENTTSTQDVVNEQAVTQDVDDNFEVEVVDDTLIEGSKKQENKVDNAKDSPDEEMEEYTAGVQKRIDKLTQQYRGEKRSREEAIRLQEEALRYAQQMKAENERLKKTLDDGEGTLIEQAKGRIAAQMDKAKSTFKAAYEAGDPEALLAAQEQLTAVQNEKYRVDNYRPQQRVQRPTPQPQYQQPAPQQPQVDQKALEWGKKNDWFEKDPEMTGYAYGLHEKLVKQGIDPRSDQYYKEIDKSVRRVFPDRFDDGSIEEEAPQRQNGSVVAAPSKTTKKPRTVRLSPSQASLAKRLGLTNEQYAAQVMKDASK